MLFWLLLLLDFIVDFLFFQQFFAFSLQPFLLTFVDVRLGLAAVRAIVRHDIDLATHPGRVIVIDSGLSLRVRLRSNNARTGQVIFAFRLSKRKEIRRQFGF